jgi:hypothetical protein
LEVINVKAGDCENSVLEFSVFKRFASNLGEKRAEWKSETEDWGNRKRPECILVPDLFGFFGDSGWHLQQHPEGLQLLRINAICEKVVCLQCS